MTISELVARAHDNAVKHGFWNPAPEFGTAIALIHSELSESLEEARAGKPELYFKEVNGFTVTDLEDLFRVRPPGEEDGRLSVPAKGTGNLSGLLRKVLRKRTLPLSRTRPEERTERGKNT